MIEFTNSNYIYVNSYKDFKNISENFEYFLIASWRDYEPLVKLLKNYKKKVIVYSEAGGIDFWDLGADQLFKSKATFYYFQMLEEIF